MLLLVVEVVSPSSVTLDRVTKPAVYAEQGNPVVLAHRRRTHAAGLPAGPAAGSYVREAELGPGTRAELATPWPLTVDTAELVIPHRR